MASPGPEAGGESREAVERLRGVIEVEEEIVFSTRGEDRKSGEYGTELLTT